MRTALLLAASLLLAGCFLNTGTSRVTSDYQQQVRAVGVVSLLAEPNLSHLSTSAMESNFARAAIAGFDSDRVVFERTVPRLRSKGMDARAVARDATLEAARGSDWRAPGQGGVSAAVYALGEAQGLDLVIVIQANLDNDFVSDTNQKIRGYGLQKAWDEAPELYATISVEAFDIRKRFVVARAIGRQQAPADGLWQPRFETTRGEIALDGAPGTAVASALEPLLGNAISVALQEAGF
ncbi:MAG: hypothetical protein ACU85V_02435 [Gammaproteobacteria bacterium]